ncbi:hypothetical protein [Clostridium sp. ATCC 25772]|uniref:hypothetical protein n=1 Tax=Clostridium sp. ATCC 25772 TaxID=1676991 RepID=UPI0007842F4B|nr:hypothetical protein [Clostridium sp. ATCC 25772]
MGMNIKVEESIINNSNNYCSDITIEHKQIGSSGVNSGEKKLNKAKVPVLLATVFMKTTILEEVTIPEGYISIEECKRDVFIKNCKILYDNLIVEGYILKDICYATPKYGDSNLEKYNFCENYLRNVKIKIPFNISTIISELNSNSFTENKNGKVLNKDNKKRYFEENFNTSSICENYFKNSLTFNDLPYGDLTGWTIEGVDNYKRENKDTKLYKVFSEKISLNLDFDIYVKKYVEVTII